MYVNSIRISAVDSSLVSRTRKLTRKPELFLNSDMLNFNVLLLLLYLVIIIVFSLVFALGEPTADYFTWAPPPRARILRSARCAFAGISMHYRSALSHSSLKQFSSKNGNSAEWRGGDRWDSRFGNLSDKSSGGRKKINSAVTAVQRRMIMESRQALSLFLFLALDSPRLALVLFIYLLTWKFLSGPAARRSVFVENPDTDTAEKNVSDP